MFCKKIKVITTVTAALLWASNTHASTCVSSGLLSDVKSYVAETQHGTAHVTKWERVLVAFGRLDSKRSTLLPFTSSEAAAEANRWGSTRWGPVKTALSCIESAALSSVQTYADGCTSASLLARAWRNSQDTASGSTRRRRWSRVIGTFTNGNFGYGFLGLQEAKAYAGQDSSAWDPVVSALRCIANPPTVVQQDPPQVDTQAQQQTPTPPTPSVKSQVEGYADGCASGSLLGKIYDYSQETGKGEVHVGRWNQVLAAFTDGEFGEDEDPMSASEAQGYANRGWSRWVPVAQALQCAEGSSSARDPPQTETPQTETQQTETQQPQTLGWRGGFCLSNTNNNRAKFTQEEDGTIVFEVTEADRYACEIAGLDGLVGEFSGRPFTGISGISQNRYSPRLRGSSSGKTLFVYDGRHNDDSVWTGDRESSVLTIDNYKFKLKIKEDDPVLEPTLGSGCTGNKAGDRVKLTKSGNVYVFSFSVNFNFDNCTVNNLLPVPSTQSGQVSHNFSGGNISYSRINELSLKTTGGSPHGTLKFDDNNLFTVINKDGHSSVLTIGGRQFRVNILHTGRLQNTSPRIRKTGTTGTVTGCASNNGAADATLTSLGNGEFEIQVAEEGDYSCTIETFQYISILARKEYQGHHYFPNLQGVKNANAYIYNNKGRDASVIFKYANADNSKYTGDRTSGYLQLTNRKIKLKVIEDEIPDPSFNTYCNSSDGGVDAIIRKKGDVFEIVLAEEGRYNCYLDNIVKDGNRGTYYFTGLSGIPTNDHRHLALQVLESLPVGSNDQGLLGFAMNDDNIYTGDRVSNILTIGERKFRLVVTDR